MREGAGFGRRGIPINLLDSYSRPEEADVHRVDVAWTLKQRAVATADNQRRV